MTLYQGGDWLRGTEKIFSRRMGEIAERVVLKQVWERTDFLTPREQMIAKQVCDRAGCVIVFDGGYPGAERVRGLCMPDNWFPETSDFRIEMLRVFAEDGTALSHGAVLGSILGLGIERRVLGDIATTHTGAIITVTTEMATYITNHLHYVGHSAVHIDPCTGQCTPEPPTYMPQTLTISSLRVDALVAGACKLSRSGAQALIERGHVSLNFSELNDVDEAVVAGDVLSIRGFGRVKMMAELGLSKKEKHRIEVGVLKSRSK